MVKQPSITRISFANLVRDLNGHRIGHINRQRLRRGQLPRIEAPGGAAHLSPECVEILRKRFRARAFERDGDTPDAKIDARFQVPTRMVTKVLQFFEDRANQHLFETDPMREVREEFRKKDEYLPPIAISDNDVLRLSSVFIANVRQLPPAAYGTSAREIEGIPTRRLFRMHSLLGPPELVSRLLSAPALRILSAEELATTARGTQKGITHDGIEIADNLF